MQRSLIFGALLSTTVLAGCVSQGDYDALKAQNQQLQQQVAQQSSELSATKAQLCRLQGAVKYTVNSDLLFPSGGYEMSARGKDIIARLAQKLAPTQQNKLVVDGFTDNVPISPALQKEGITSNEVLSQKRAENVMQFLISKGAKPDLVSAQGFGEKNPVASNDTPKGRAQNRRVELSLANSGC